MSRNRLFVSLCLALCVAAIAAAGAGADPAGTVPSSGGWKGKTTQGFPIYFGVREGPTVTNFRLTYREVVCGKQSLHRKSVSLEVDAAGHFAGAIVENRVEIEGTFTGPGTVEGRIVALETTGLPGCTRQAVRFSAQPKS